MGFLFNLFSFVLSRRRSKKSCDNQTKLISAAREIAAELCNAFRSNCSSRRLVVIIRTTLYHVTLSFRTSLSSCIENTRAWTRPSGKQRRTCTDVSTDRPRRTRRSVIEHGKRKRTGWYSYATLKVYFSRLNISTAQYILFVDFENSSYR